MNDATLTWSKSLTGTPTGYTIIFTVNGTAKPAVLVPANTVSDSSGYSLDVANALGITFAPGDIIGATVQAVDAVHNLTSGTVVSSPASVTIPTTPVAPSDPQNVVLTLS